MKHMRRMFILGLFVLFSWFSAGTAFAEQQLTASGHPEYPPVMWRQGRIITGAGPELLKLVFKSLGVAVNCSYKGDWLTAQDKLKTGEIDALAGVYLTEERKAFMAFSVPFMKDPVVIFVARGKAFPFETWDDLVGRKGVSTAGDSFGQAFDAFIHSRLHVTRLVTVKENFERLLSGEADYFIFSKYSGEFEAKKLGFADQIASLKKEAAVENFHFAFSKKSKFTSLLPKVNAQIDKLVNNGTVEKLITIYSDIYEQSREKKD